MTIPEIKIEVPQVNSYVIKAPQINPPNVPVLVPIGFPVIQMPCVEARRASYENEALVNNDPDGNVVLCDGGVPSFTPMDYTPEEIVPIQDSKPAEQAEQETPQAVTPDIPNNQKEKEDIFFVECPGSKDQRIGDFRNEKRLERVKGHKRSEDGSECITLYEPVTFVEQYLPSAATASFTAATAVVAATTPLILNIIKPLVKNLIKKLTTKKKNAKVENEIT